MRRKVLLGVFLLLLCFCGVSVGKARIIEIAPNCFIYPDTVKYETFNGHKYITYWWGVFFPDGHELEGKQIDETKTFFVIDRERQRAEMLSFGAFWRGIYVVSEEKEFSEQRFAPIPPDSFLDVSFKAAVKILDSQKKGQKK